MANTPQQDAAVANRATPQNPVVATSSLLPRSSASTSGTSTPIGRPAASTMSPRRAASSLSAAQQGTATTRRASTHATAATAMASTDGSNAVPSMFGYYSHDTSTGALIQRNQNSSTLSSNYANYWRANPVSPFATNNRTSSDAVRIASNSNSPRIGSGSMSSFASPMRQGGAYSYLDNTSYNQKTSQSQFQFEENSLVSFTWTISDLHLLRDEVENTSPPSEDGRSVSAGAGKSEVWTTRPVFGDGKWRLELVRTRRQLPEEEDSEERPTTPVQAAPSPAQATTSEEQEPAPLSKPKGITVLSVYLTSVVLDYSHSDVEIPSSIMIGIRPARESIGSRGSANGGWCWRQFYPFNFRREHEFFECHDLPSISELLDIETIRRDDAMALTIQVGRGTAHAVSTETRSFMPPFEAEGAHLVPRSILESLQGLLDDANTGDVRVIVRERGLLDSSSSIIPYPVGSSPLDEGPWQSSDKILVRDRVFWTHSNILQNRSDYFKTMLSSNFIEGNSRHQSNNGRQIRTLRIPDADFVTTYWFLRYLYTEEIRFAEQEDVRSAVLDEDWAGPVGEAKMWEWTSIKDAAFVAYAAPSRTLSGRTSTSSLGAKSADAPSEAADPHSHPTAPPPPASALAIFKLAHRYNMSDLSDLASAHIVSTLCPPSAFPVLLATSVYTNLHDKVKKYVYNNWESVSNTEEFERCCNEVSTGEWGSEAGKALRTFMKSLISPARVVPKP